MSTGPSSTSENNIYVVHHENGGTMQVYATDEDDAIEQYYHTLESILGHHLKICDCYGKKPIDRSKVARPLRVEKVGKL